MLALPFPAIGKEVGDFPLYDSLLSGAAERAARGKANLFDYIPAPDAEAVEAVRLIRAKERHDVDEQAFLAYSDVLEALRLALESLKAAT